MAGLHTSCVQGFPSEQLTGAPEQRMPPAPSTAHTSPVVQAVWSSHGEPAGSAAPTHEPEALQVSKFVHESLSSQGEPSASTLPRHTPLEQTSPDVQELPSLQAKLVKGALQQPVLLQELLLEKLLHESAVQGFPSSQLTAS